MPTDTQETLDSAEFVVTRAGLGPNHNPDQGYHEHEIHEGIAPHGAPAEHGVRLRNPLNPAHVLEDVKMLLSKHPEHDKRQLDWKSFKAGYQKATNPIEFEVRGPDGNLKQIVRTHNVRTNNGGAWQAAAMFGDVPANIYQSGTYTASAAGTTSTGAGANSGTYVSALGSMTAAATAAGATAWAANALAGHILVVSNATAATTLYGVIVAHTANTTPGTTAMTFYVDRWHVLGYAGTGGNTTTDAAGTPAATGAYLVLPNTAPALYLALSNDNTNNLNGGLSQTTNTQAQLQWTSGELVSSLTGASDTGLGRRIATTALTAPTGGTTTTQTGSMQLKFTFTAGQAGGTVYRSGIFVSAVSATVAHVATPVADAGNVLVFEAMLLTSATLAQNDTLAVTWTVTY